MGDDDWQGIRMTRAEVDEVNIEPVDRRDELRQGIELRLHLPPVVVRAPVANEFLELRELHALRPICDGLLFGPPRRQHALAKVRRALRPEYRRGTERIRPTGSAGARSWKAGCR